MPPINKVRFIADAYPDLDLDHKTANWKRDNLSLQRISEEINAALEAYLRAEVPKELGRLPKLRVDKQHVRRFFTSPQEAKARQVAIATDKRRGVKAVVAQIAVQLAAAENLRKLKGMIEPFAVALKPAIDGLTAIEMTGRASEDKEQLSQLKDLFYAVEPVVRSLTLMTMNEHQVHKDSLSLEMVAIFLKKVMYYVQAHLEPEAYWELIQQMESDPQMRPVMAALGLLEEGTGNPGPIEGHPV